MKSPLPAFYTVKVACRELRGMTYYLFDISCLHKNICKNILRFLFMKRNTHTHTHSLTSLTGLVSIVRILLYHLSLWKKSCGALIIVCIHLHLLSLNIVTITFPYFLLYFNEQIIFHWVNIDKKIYILIVCSYWIFESSWAILM